MWLILSMAMVAVLSIVSLSFRYSVEQKNKAVGIVAELSTVRELALGQAMTVEEGLRFLKTKGLTGVVLGEEYVADLSSIGYIEVLPQGGTTVVSGEPRQVGRVARAIQTRYPSVVMTLGKDGFAVPLSPEAVRPLPVNINPDDAELAKRLNLQIISRHINPNGSSGKTVEKTIQWASELGSTVFLPQGMQVLGRRDNMEELVKALESTGMLYASAEFGKIGGDQNVVEMRPESIIRLHSAQADELDKLPYSECIDRYVRAAKERNQRLLLLRPVSSSAPLPLTEFAKFVEDVSTQLTESGFTIQPPHPFSDPGVPRVLFVAIGCFVAAVVWWTAAVFVRSRPIRVVGAFLLGLLAVGCYVATGRQFMALFGAIAFPTLAFILVEMRARQGLRGWPWWYLAMSIISLIGGLQVAGLLNGLDYYIRADQFAGVKAAHFLPILLVGLYYFARFSKPSEVLQRPVLWIQAGLAIVILGALAFMIARTGNDNPAAVSGFELKIRDLLDKILLVRPRTKEFMVGHPALIVGLGFLAAWSAARMKGAGEQGGAGWIPVLMMVGAIGQTSIVNTMCHLHTPLMLSITRLGMGLLAGAVVGAVVWILVARLSRPRTTAP
jgi:hypothetical protein